MERGLIWLPLLLMFFWLAWSGWNEYQKVESYRLWSEAFDKSKYDIYAVLGQKQDQVTWGKPTRNGPVDLQVFSLKNISEIRLLRNNQPIQEEETEGKGVIALEFVIVDQSTSVQIPFTELSLAVQWAKYLREKLLEMDN